LVITEFSGILQTIKNLHKNDHIFVSLNSKIPSIYFGNALAENLTEVCEKNGVNPILVHFAQSGAKYKSKYQSFTPGQGAV